MPPARPGHALLRWAPTLLVVGACVAVGRTVDIAQLRAGLVDVRVAPLGCALLLAALTVVCHAACWRAWVHPTADVSLGQMTAYTFASYAASTLLPLRAGEALRFWLLKRHHGVPLTHSGAVIALEKAADIGSMMLVVSPLLWLMPGLPASVKHVLRLLPIGVVAALGAIAIASRYGAEWRWLGGFHLLGSVRVAAKGFAFVLAAWLLDVGAILSILDATRLEVSLDAALVVLLLVNVAIAVPSTPGQLGAHELGSTVALGLLGIAPGKAIAFALFYHMTQLAPVLALGLGSARALARLPQPDVGPPPIASA